MKKGQRSDPLREAEYPIIPQVESQWMRNILKRKLSPVTNSKYSGQYKKLTDIYGGLQMRKKFEIDQLGIGYTGIYDDYKYIVSVMLPNFKNPGPNRIITKTLAQARAFKNRNTITNILVWPHTKRDIEKHQKYDKWENFKDPQVVFS